jgi:hypothetical protein
MPTRHPAPYNADILAVACRRPKCQAKVSERCKGNSGYRITPPHIVRINDAGYIWDNDAKRLVKDTGDA